MTTALVGIGIGLGINIIMLAFTYGKLAQKVDSLSKQINNGWTCKKHAIITQQIGELQGANWDGKERRHLKI
jgi:hypothetical protein